MNFVRCRLYNFNDEFGDFSLQYFIGIYSSEKRQIKYSH
jgi:hypothetical protein